MKTIHVVAAIIKDGNKIFATQRGYGEFKDGWEFPGGKVEPNETSKQAIVREIKEELDTTIQVEEYFDTVEYDYPNFHLSMECFICTILEGNLTLLEHESAKWLTKDTLDLVDWLPADLGLIAKLKDIIIPYNILKHLKTSISSLHKEQMIVFLLSNCQIINKFTGINNVFTLKFYNWNWLLDVVGGYLLLRRFEALNLEFQVSRSFYFFTGGKLMYIYLHINVAMCLFAIVEILKVTLMIIEKCKAH